MKKVFASIFFMIMAIPFFALDFNEVYLGKKISKVLVELEEEDCDWYVDKKDWGCVYTITNNDGIKYCSVWELEELFFTVNSDNIITEQTMFLKDAFTHEQVEKLFLILKNGDQGVIETYHNSDDEAYIVMKFPEDGVTFTLIKTTRSTMLGFSLSL